MANTKITALPEITSVNSGDFLYIVDVTDTTDSSAGSSRKIQQQNLVAGANSTITSLSGLTTPLSVAQGGTGAATLTGIVKGSGTSAMMTVTAPTGTIVGTTDTQVLTNKDLTSGTNTFPTSLVTLTGSQTLTNKVLTSPTLTTPVISSITNTGTLTLPTTSDTLVGRATTDTLTNKTLTSPAINTPSLNGANLGITTDTDGSTITFDLSNSLHQVVLGGSRTLALSNLAVGKVFAIDLIQDSTGSRIVTWFASNSATATMTIASPCVVTTGVDIPTLTPVIFTNSGGALPTGVVSGTTYYYIRVSGTTGNLATSIANAQAGTKVNTSGSQSGTQTCAIQLRWFPNQIVPTLSTAAYTKDSFGFKCPQTGILDAYIIGQGA